MTTALPTADRAHRLWTVLGLTQPVLGLLGAPVTFALSALPTVAGAALAVLLGAVWVTCLAVGVAGSTRRGPNGHRYRQLLLRTTLAVPAVGLSWLGFATLSGLVLHYAWQ